MTHAAARMIYKSRDYGSDLGLSIDFRAED